MGMLITEVRDRSDDPCGARAIILSPLQPITETAAIAMAYSLGGSATLPSKRCDRIKTAILRDRSTAGDACLQILCPYL